VVILLTRFIFHIVHPTLSMVTGGMPSRVSTSALADVQRSSTVDSQPLDSAPARCDRSETYEWWARGGEERESV
jgi:hypothetical protein